jgi:hypothetical protein
MWMRFCPRERILLGVEKPINDDGITLDRLPSKHLPRVGGVS